MSATQWQLRYGTAAQVNVRTPAPRELWALTDWDNLLVIGDGSEVGGIPVNRLPRGALHGMEMAIAADTAHDITFSPGQARSANDGGDLRSTAAVTKQIDAPWAEGSAAGGFPSALTLSADTWYHAFAIGKTRNGTGGVDFGFDTSLTASNLLADATGYSYYRRLGSILTNATADLVQFTQYGDRFEFKNVVVDDVDTTIGTTPGNHTLTVPPGITGLRALFNVSLQKASANPFAFIYSPDRSDTTLDRTNGAANLQAPTGGYAVPSMEVVVNTSGQIRAVASESSVNLAIGTWGWIDPRGRNG